MKEETVSLWKAEGQDVRSIIDMVELDLAESMKKIKNLQNSVRELLKFQCQRELTLEDMAEIKEASDGIAQEVWVFGAILSAIEGEIGPEC